MQSQVFARFDEPVLSTMFVALDEPPNARRSGQTTLYVREAAKPGILGDRSAPVGSHHGL